MNYVGTPKVSIIMATYNRSQLIKETLNSIISQNFKEWECLIIDDGSNDDTFEIIKDYLIIDNRFKYFKRGEEYRKGLPGARNKGLDQAQGRYIQFFDDDDIIHTENLKTTVQILEENEYNFCRYDKEPFTGKYLASQFEKIGQFEKTVFSKFNLGDMLTGKIPFASCTVLWEKKCFEKIRFNEDLMYAEDWECYSRILSQDFIGVSINQVLYYNRKHPESNTGEFWNKNPISVASKIQAAKLIVNTLASKKLFNSKLEKFFIRMSFSLKSNSLLEIALYHSDLSAFNKFKYKFGYLIYPILRPLFILKGKLQSA